MSAASTLPIWAMDIFFGAIPLGFRQTIFISALFQNDLDLDPIDEGCTFAAVNLLSSFRQ